MPDTYPLPLLAPQDTPADLQVDPGTGRVLLPLRLTGDRVLHQKAATVTVFDDALAQLVDDMFATMYAAPGVGLAAPQVGIGIRLFVYDCGPGKKGHVVNPTCLAIPGALQDEDEGCLSIPGLYYPTPRAKTAVVRGVDVDGTPLELEGTELLARCFQHETDHLDGMLYVERLGGRTRKAADKATKAADWFGTTIKPLVPKALQPVDDDADSDDEDDL